MNVLPRLILSTALLISSNTQAQDTSSWSDKTICRLANSSGTQAYVDETVKRNLDCVASSSGTSSPSLTDPLNELSLPSDWQLSMYPAVFDQERRLISAKTIGQSTDHFWRPFAKGCYDVMSNWQKSLMWYAKNQEAAERSSAVTADSESYRLVHVDTCLDYYAQLPGMLGATPDELQSLILGWSKTNPFKLPSTNDRYYQSKFYQTVSVLSVLTAYYAVYYDEFDYTTNERQQVDSFLSDWMLKLKVRSRPEGGSKVCHKGNIQTHVRLLRNHKTDHNTCGSLVWKEMVGQLLLGLRLGNEELFKAGVATTQWQLNFFDKTGIFTTWASKGASSMQYTGDLPTFLGLLTEIYASIGYDFMQHKIPNGLTIKQVMDRQVDIHQDHMVLADYALVGGAYKGVDADEFKEWDSLTALHLAGTNMKTMVREMARYVDQYRPDLQHLRDRSYRPRDMNAQSIQILGSFHAIEPYKMYLGSTETQMVREDIIPPRPKRIDFKTKKSLIAAFKSLVPEVHHYDILYGNSKAMMTTGHDGRYKVEWFFLNIDGTTQLRATDMLEIEGGRITFTPSGASIPTIAQRNGLNFKLSLGQLITAKGLVSSVEGSSPESINIHVNLNNSAGYGVSESGKIAYIWQLTKLEN